MDFEVTSGSYKSIAQPFSWKNIPNFSVITGENGAGKSQLLELINMQYDPSQANIKKQFTDVRINIQNAKYSAHEVVFLKNFSQGEGSPQVGLNEISSEITNIFNQINQNRPSNDPYEQGRFQRISSILADQGVDKNLLDNDKLYDLLPNDFFFSNPNKALANIAKHFYNYQIDLIQLQADKKTEVEIEKEIGEKPWDEFNNLLKNSNLRYEVTTPEGLNIRTRYQLKLKDKISNLELDPQHLSTGEIAIIKLYCWLFITKGDFSFPKLILLDEPDSHLHPFFIKTFVDSIYGGIVKGYGARVIMTTHRIETVSLIPNESLFEMHAAPSRIKQSTNKGKTINLLTNNLFSVVSGKKPIFVEDEDDVEFYELVTNILKEDYSKFNGISLVFVPSSLGKGNPKNPGGKNSVRSWVGKLQKAGLFEIVKGVVDKDQGNSPEEGVYAINRYSFENYLLDPIVVFSVLLDNNLHSTLDLTLEIQIGEEGKIKELPSDDLNLISSSIFSQVVDRLRPEVNENDKELVSIKYLNGKEILVPKWFISHRGHDLMAAFRGKWPQVRHDNLVHHFKKIRLVPEELFDFLNNVVSN